MRGLFFLEPRPISGGRKSMETLLESIHSPADLKRLNLSLIHI